MQNNNNININDKEHVGKEPSNYEKYSKLLDYALEMSETLMLKEKAARGEDVIISTRSGKIIRIPAKKILDTWDKYMDLLDMPLMKSSNSTTTEYNMKIPPQKKS